MGISLEKMLSGWKKKQNPETKKDVEAPQLDAEVVSKYKERMMGIVYEDTDANTFAEMFALAESNMKDAEKASKIVEEIFALLELKEKQLQAISDGSAFKQESSSEEDAIENDGEHKDADDEIVMSVEDYITKK